MRTGDTPQKERTAMRRQAPHILVTTPESLYVLLGSESGRVMLGGVRTVIVDEIHALLPAKRGSHLALSLERLDALTGHRATRVGLSATQKPIEDAARFLVGTGRMDADGNADCRIVDVGHDKPRDLAIERCHPVLQVGQFLGDVAGHQVTTGGQDLPELDEDRPERFQRFAQTDGAWLAEVPTTCVEAQPAGNTALRLGFNQHGQ